MATHPLNACPLVRCTRHARRLRITSMCNVRMLVGYGGQGLTGRHAAAMNTSTLSRLRGTKSGRWMKQGLHATVAWRKVAAAQQAGGYRRSQQMLWV